MSGLEELVRREMTAQVVALGKGHMIGGPAWEAFLSSIVGQVERGEVQLVDGHLPHIPIAPADDPQKN